MTTLVNVTGILGFAATVTMLLMSLADRCRARIYRMEDLS